MTVDDFADLVSKMRTTQKEFFRTRSPTTMSEAKALERKVDQALEEREERKAGKAQPGLFEGTNE